MSKKYLYSPRPMFDYRLHGVPYDEVQAIADCSLRDSAWNLFWLSSPTLDKVPEAGPRWHHVYRIQEYLLAHVTRDLYGDEALTRRVLMHPHSFAEWFEVQDYRHYLTYQYNGGKNWVDNVLNRARMAGDRILAESPPVTVAGNVISVNFGQHAA